MIKFILLVFSLFLVGCSSSLVVKPVYIDPEADTRNRFLKGLKDYDKNPLKEKVPALLKDSETYILRMDYKITQNNRRALK